MPLFGNSSKDHPVTSMLRCMEHGDFVDAYRALRRRGKRDDLIPPPHALWRLGRWLFEKGHAKRARLPLETFLELYRRHQDRDKVMLDLARVLAKLGNHKRAVALKTEALG